MRAGRPGGTCCGAPPSGPAPPGKRQVQHARRVAAPAARARPSSARGRARAAAPRGWPSSRSPARLTRRRRSLAVEGEDRHVDLLHHLAQQRGGLERAQALLAQRVGQRVDLAHDLAQRVVAAAARGARMEKSSSRSAASRLESVCSGRTTRSRSAKAKPPARADDDRSAERPAARCGE